MPTCEQMKSAELIGEFLIGVDKSNGQTRMNNILVAWYNDRMSNPSSISLLEITRATEVKKREEIGDSKQGLLDLFAEMNATPVTVVDASEGYGT